MNSRKTFLISMYNQLCHEMDRHIKITWQIAGVLLSSTAVFALAELKAIHLDIAATIIVIVCFLNVGIITESNFWYYRNLIIVTNIERVFLLKSDEKDIHHYFTRHKAKLGFLDMMKIQILFVFSVLALILGHHFHSYLYQKTYQDITIQNFLPYVFSLIGFIGSLFFILKRRCDYSKFKAGSPGIKIDPPI